MTSTCHIDRRELGRFRDGALESAAETQLLSHVETCERCQDILADLEVLGELLVENRANVVAGLAPDFAARVMSALPAERPAGQPAGQVGWTVHLAEALARNRDALLLSLLGTAVAASLLVVFAPGLRSGDRVQEAAENEAQIHQLDVSGSDQNAVVLQSAEGNTVIWLVAPADDADAGSVTQQSH